MRLTSMHASQFARPALIIAADGGAECPPSPKWHHWWKEKTVSVDLVVVIEREGGGCG